MSNELRADQLAQLSGFNLPRNHGLGAHMVAASVMQGVVKDVQKTRRFIDQLIEAGERLDRVFLLLKWPPPGHLPAVLLDRIAISFEAGALSESDVDQVLVHFYGRQQLEEMAQDWHVAGHFPRRMQILHDAVEAHLRAEYTLSIPAVLTQIEGALGDIFGHRGRMRQKDFRDYVAAAFERPSRFDTASAAFFLDTVLEQFQWGQDVPFLSRHAILHGADTEYATAAKSLRVILTFDVIQSSVRYVSSPHGRKLHRVACPTLRSSKGRRVFTAVTSLDGMSPCRICCADLIEARRMWADVLGPV
jgi:hypothetical protein